MALYSFDLNGFAADKPRPYVLESNGWVGIRQRPKKDFRARETSQTPEKARLGQKPRFGMIVESFNNERPMATVNFSVPDDVKKAFDRAFKDQNKSAVIAELMRQAVAEAERTKRRAELFRRLTDDRRLRPKVADQAVRRARTAGRP